MKRCIINLQYTKTIYESILILKAPFLGNTGGVYLESLNIINNMVPILNRSILISGVCNSYNIQTWSHVHVHMDIMESKVSPHSM